MKTNDVLIIALALAGAWYMAKKFRLSDYYGTKPFSEQSSQIAAQDEGLFGATWRPDAANDTQIKGGIWI